MEGGREGTAITDNQVLGSGFTFLGLPISESRKSPRPCAEIGSLLVDV